MEGELRLPYSSKSQQEISQQLTSVELAQIKRMREFEDEKIHKAWTQDTLEWLVNQRLELLCNRGFTYLLSIKTTKYKKITLEQDFTKKLKRISIAEFGPHGKRQGSFLPGYKINK